MHSHGGDYGCCPNLIPNGVTAVQADYHKAGPSKEPFERLLAARSIRCELMAGTQADWDSGKLKVSQTTWDEGMVTFDSIKRQAGTSAGTARIIGNIGAADVQVRMTPVGITF